jgi:hypothetical protein
MNTVEELEARRSTVLEQMRSIRSLKRGSITEQYLNVRHKGIREAVFRGPYYVFSRREGNKTSSRRLSVPELEQARQDIESHKRFVALCREFEILTEQLGEIERESPMGQEKKRLRLPSNKNPR